MNFDISQILEQWAYTPGQVIVRRFVGKDGVEKVQLRVDLGLLQMNVEGRPDGKRPFGHASLFEHYLAQLKRYEESHHGSSEGFALTWDDCAKLQQEAIQFHHRYICLYQLEDYEKVIRDTERNLAVFDFVKVHGVSDDMAWSLQQFRPQLLMMRARARGALALAEGRFAEVVGLIQQTISDIREFYSDSGRTEMGETCTEIQSLEAWLNDLQSKRPMTEREKLERALDEAVRVEDYEQAARVRDQLRNLNAPNA